MTAVAAIVAATVQAAARGFQGFMMGSAEKVTEPILNRGNTRRNGSMGMHYSIPE
jgi:hypothetical protein